MLADNRTGERYIRAAAHPSILAGKLFDNMREKLVASHANKGTRRYRYYVSRDLQHGGDAANSNGMRIPAPEIEALVCSKLAELFNDPIALIERVSTTSLAPDVTAKAIAKARTISQMLSSADPTIIAGLIERIVQRIDVGADVVTITMDSTCVADHLDLVHQSQGLLPLQITMPAKLKRSGMAVRLILPGGGHASPRIDDKLVKAIAMAHGWWEELVENPKLHISDLAAKNGVTESWVTRMLWLVFLDPAIVEQVLAGTILPTLPWQRCGRQNRSQPSGQSSGPNVASPLRDSHLPPIPYRQICHRENGPVFSENGLIPDWRENIGMRKAAVSRGFCDKLKNNINILDCVAGHDR